MNSNEKYECIHLEVFFYQHYSHLRRLPYMWMLERGRARLAYERARAASQPGVLSDQY